MKKTLKDGDGGIYPGNNCEESRPALLYVSKSLGKMIPFRLKSYKQDMVFFCLAETRFIGLVL
jgi:hypothetical protein